MECEGGAGDITGFQKVLPLCSNVPTRVARPRPCHDRGRATRVVILHVKWGPQGQMGHTVSRRYAAGCYACRGATRRGARGWSDSRSRDRYTMTHAHVTRVINRQPNRTRMIKRHPKRRIHFPIKPVLAIYSPSVSSFSVTKFSVAPGRTHVLSVICTVTLTLTVH